MPIVGKKKFAYTKAGLAKAKAEAKRTGKKLVGVLKGIGRGIKKPLSKAKPMSGGRGRKVSAYKHEKGVGTHKLSTEQQKAYRKRKELNTPIPGYKKMSGGRERLVAGGKLPKKKRSMHQYYQPRSK